MKQRSIPYFTALTGLIVSAGILYFAIPRTGAAFAALNGAWIADRLVADVKPSDDDIRKLALSRNNAQLWSNDPEYARHLALAYQEMAKRASPDQRKSLVQASHDATFRELTMRPMNGIAWWRLGKASYNLAGGPSRKTASYQWRSVQMAPNIMIMMPVRLNSILLNWFYFEPEARKGMQDQFAAAWRWNRPSVLKIAENRLHRSVIRAVMAADPALLQEYEARLAREEARRTQN